MIKEYKIIEKIATYEHVEKKSRFIANIVPVETEEDAISFIEEMRKKYWDARHNCSAFVIGNDAKLVRCSDDGEPSGTAGRPMLDVLLGEELKNVCIVVTRYFGGTLLGTGGLVKAYQTATKQAIQNSQVLTKIYGLNLELSMGYTELGKVQYILANDNIPVLASNYEDVVVMKIFIKFDDIKAVKEKLIESTNASIKMTDFEYSYYIDK